MKGHRKEPWVQHGTVERFIKKGIHGSQKANGRELRAGSLPNVIRETRAKVQAEQPDASSAEIEAIVERRCCRGMKSHTPASYVAKALPEENLVSVKDLAKSKRKKPRRSGRR